MDFEISYKYKPYKNDYDDFYDHNVYKKLMEES